MLGAPTGKRLAPVLADLVARLRRFGEPVVTDEVAGLLVGMAPASMDRRLAPTRPQMRLRGAVTPTRVRAIPIRTWADLCAAVPGFFEVALVGHDSGSASVNTPTPSR